MLHVHFRQQDGREEQPLKSAAKGKRCEKTTQAWKFPGADFFKNLKERPRERRAVETSVPAPAKIRADAGSGIADN